MIKKSLFDGVRVPHPPVELRARVLAQAESSDHSKESLSWADRIWQNRVLCYTWASMSIVLFFILIFWNPPLPGIHSVDQQFNASDEIREVLSPEIYGPQHSFAQLGNPNYFRTLEQEAEL